MDTCKIAILLATYNGEKYIREQLDSILQQTRSDWDLFVHDDGSKDGTVAIFKEYEANYPEKIHMIDGPSTGGAKNNFFFLMRSVDAPYVMFCDQDDVWFPEKIQKTFDAMLLLEKKQTTDQPLLVFSELAVVDSRLNIIAERMSNYQNLNCFKTDVCSLMIQNVVTGCTVMINRTLLKMSVTVFSHEAIIMHDWWCALIASKYGKVMFIPEPLILYRQHGDNSVGAKNSKGMRYIIEKLKSTKSICKSLQDTRRQALLFSRHFQLPKNDVITLYSELGGKRRVQKWFYHLRYHVWKEGFARNVGMIFFE